MSRTLDEKLTAETKKAVTDLLDEADSLLSTALSNARAGKSFEDVYNDIGEALQILTTANDKLEDVDMED